MLGYTIDKSIELLEKRVKSLEAGGGGGGATNWNQLQNKPFNSLGEEFYNLDGALTIQNISSDKIALPDSEHYNWENVSEAVEGMNEELGHINGDIIDLTTEVNSLDVTKQDNLTAGSNIVIENNVISASGTDIYDNNERVVGTWFGKPLYRKTFTFNDASTFNMNIPSSDIKRIEATMRRYRDSDSSYFATNPYYFSSTDWWNFYTRNNDVTFRVSSGVIGTYTFNLIVEYTKPTD